MDKNTIIGLLLIFALFMGFSFYTSQKNAKHREQVEKEMLAQEEKAREDSIANAVATSMADQMMNDTTASSTSTAANTPATETQQKLPLYAVAFQMPADAQNGDFKVVTNKAIYSFARQGGYLKRIELKDEIDDINWGAVFRGYPAEIRWWMWIKDKHLKEFWEPSAPAK